MILTHAQRQALKRIYDRGPLAVNGQMLQTPCGDAQYPLTYREFRRYARPAFDCVMVPWCGMWLGIEPDGYTHS